MSSRRLPRWCPLLCSIKAGIAILGRSERSIYDMIYNGDIEAVKSDRRTMLVVQSLKDYVARLPRAKGTLVRRAGTQSKGDRSRAG
jgi:hypothetical protein